MLPRIEEMPLSLVSRKEALISVLQSDEYVRNLLAKAGNAYYKPWKDKLLKQKHYSPFGDFPPELKKLKEPNESLFFTPEKKTPLKSVLNEGIAVGNYIKKKESNGKKLKPIRLKMKSMHEFGEKNQKRPIAGAFKKRLIPLTEFRRLYERGDLPAKIDYQKGKALVWKIDLDRVDYHFYLPIFFEGLREKTDPCRMMAVYGLCDLLEKGGRKILPTIPQLIIPIKTNLNTRDEDILTLQLKMLQKLLLCDDLVGQALVPYYRQLLPIFRLFYSKNSNLGDFIDYSQRKGQNLGDLIEETLQMMESTGGEDAFINIKYIIPTYESSMI